jgi:protein-disulfide isomerase
MRLLTCSVFLLLLLLTATTAAPNDTAHPSTVVATLGTRRITEDDLTRAIGNRLMRILTEEYNVRRAVLDELITEELLSKEAKRRGTTVDELLKLEIDSKVTVPDRSELKPFYDGTKEHFGSATESEALQQIAAGMQRHRIAQRKSDFVRSLRAAAHVSVLIQPPRAEVGTNGPARGPSSALVTIVEFSDFECPFCGRVETTMRQIEHTYGDRVRIVFRDFPLASHRGAPRAAEAAHCADEQDKFWEMHEQLFSRAGALSDIDLHKYANVIGLDAQKFDACLQSGKYSAAWKASQSEGLRIGVASTPTFFVNGRMIAGAAPFEMFASVINEELESAATRTIRPAVEAKLPRGQR